MSVDIRRSALVTQPATRVFDVIEAAEHYPEFLPWCVGATILERSDELVAARLTVAWRQVRFSFVTRNPKQRPLRMDIGLAEGPFRRFEGSWRLTPLSDWGCRVDFSLSYEFGASMLDPLAGPMFERATATLMEAFVQRAERVAQLPLAPPPMPPSPAPPAAPPLPSRPEDSR
jgi:ribosome-associated toxin RatA of RatAB toxin-antitoxin module